MIREMIGQFRLQILLQMVEQEGIHGAVLGSPLVHGLHRVEAFFVDVILDHRIHEVGDILVVADVVPDAGGTHILKIRGQLQVQHFALEPFRSGAPVRPCPLRVAGEEDMGEGVDRILAGLRAVCRRIFHHIAAGDDIDLFPGEACPQPGQVPGIGDVDRHVRREQEYAIQVGDGHDHDLSAHPVGLGVLGPGELIHRQVDVEAHGGDLPDNGLVSKGEGIERPREEGDLRALPERDPVMILQIIGDKPVYVVEGCRVVVPQRDLLIPQDEDQDLARHGGEVVFFLLQSQVPAAEQSGSQEIEGFPGNFHVIVHGPGEQDAFKGGALFRGNVGVGQVLKDHADRLEGQDHDTMIGAGVQVAELGQERLALSLGHNDVDAAHELRDVFCHGIASHGERAHQFQHDLIALGFGQPGHDPDQVLARLKLVGHAVRELQQVQQVGSVLIDPQKIRLLHHFLLQDLQIHQLVDPGDLGALILDVQELGVIVKDGILAEDSLADLRRQVAHADRVGRGGGDVEQRRLHLVVRAASLAEPAGDETQGGYPDLIVL